MFWDSVQRAEAVGSLSFNVTWVPVGHNLNDQELPHAARLERKETITSAPAQAEDVARQLRDMLKRYRLNVQDLIQVWEERGFCHL